VVDLFEEVEEDLRADKVKSAARRALPWVLGLTVGVVVIGGGFVGWRLWDDARTAKASQAYDAIIRGESAQDAESAFAAFGDIAKKAPGAYRAMSLMNQGAIRMDQGNTKEAVALLDEAANAAPRNKAGQILADAARLKSALALLDDAPYAESEERLKPLTEDGRPFRALAMEALALAKLSAGKTQEARADFLVLSAAVDAPQSLTQRAKAAVDLIDSGAAGSISAAVKAAKALPPPGGGMQLPPEILQQLQAQGVQLQEGAPAK
jgi:hypothetical protein